MIYFNLPHLYDNKKLFSTITSLPNNVFKTQVRFISHNLYLPYNYFNGKINYNMNYIFTYHKLLKQNEFNIIKNRIDLSNINIDTIDYNDKYLNTVLDIFQNGTNQIEITNLEMFEYIINKYPYYHYIFSSNGDIVQPFTPDILNVILDNEKINFVNIPNTKLDLIDQINKKYKIELTVNNLCSNCSINQQQTCKTQEQINIYNFTNTSCINKCAKINNATIISIEDILQKYLPIGIQHYSLEEIPLDKMQDFLLFFVKYFIIEQYQIDIFNKLIKENNDDKLYNPWVVDT